MTGPWSVTLQAMGLTEHVHVDALGSVFLRFDTDTHGVPIVHEFEYVAVDAEARYARAVYRRTRLAQ